MPELQDLFSYHGFQSVYRKYRIEVQFGIDTTKKKPVDQHRRNGRISVNRDGNSHHESDNRNNYPMVYGGDKVAGGRTFYIENGKPIIK